MRPILPAHRTVSAMLGAMKLSPLLDLVDRKAEIGLAPAAVRQFSQGQASVPAIEGKPHRQDSPGV
jgi:hypothetical protein